VSSFPFRLAAFDLDGTLLSGPSSMGEANAAALHDLVARGVVVAPATARFHAVALLPFASAGLQVPAVSCAGADVRHADGRVIELRALPGACGRFLADLCDRAGWRATFATTDRAFRLAPDLPPWAATPPPYLAAVTSFADVDVGSVLNALIYARPDDPWLRELDAWADAVNIHTAITHDGLELVTITAAGVDKGSGLAALCTAYDFDTAEAVVFGDSDVDLPMFAIAGHAVAMEGAPPDVRARAHSTAPSAPGGVATAISGLLAG